MAFRWSNTPQTPKPPTPNPIPENAVSFEVNVVANTVNAGGSLLYNTAAIGYDVVYEFPSMNVIDLRVTNANIKTARINTATINTATINTATIITLNVSSFQADNATFNRLNASFANLTNASIVTLNASTLMSGDPTTNLGIATKQYVLAHSGGGSPLPTPNGNGSLLIGNTSSNSFDVNVVTPGTGIYINNDEGKITLVATGDPILSGHRYGNAWRSSILNLDTSIYWIDIAWNGIVFVAISTSGIIITSPDGIRWTMRSSKAGSWAGIVWNNSLNHFVVVGEDIVGPTGTKNIMTSSDGMTWTVRNTGIAGQWQRIMWDGVQYIATHGTASSEYMTSPNGLDWTSRQFPVPLQYTEVASNGAMHVVIGIGGGLATSPDGQSNWQFNTVVSGGVATGLAQSIVWNNFNKFVLIWSASGVSNSSNGIVWNTITATPLGEWRRMIWSGSQYVVVGADYNGSSFANNVMTSSDAVTWTMRPTFPASWNSVTYNGSQYVAVGNAGAIMTSPDGITWTLRGNDPDDWRSIVWNGSIFVAVRRSSIAIGGIVMTSPDGYDWTEQTASPGLWNSLAWNGSVFVAVGPNIAMTSPDGVTWTDQTTLSGSWNSVAWNGTLFAAVGPSVAMTSPDGITWTSRSATSGSWNSVTWNGSQFAAVGPSVVMTSPNGITWTSRSAISGGWKSIAWNGTDFVAVGLNAAMTSPDGIRWTSRSALSGSWEAVAWNGSVFVAVGPNIAMTSPDGRHWTSRAIPGGSYTAVAWNDSIFVAVSNNSPTAVMTNFPDEVTSVAGRVGAVVLDTFDVTENNLGPYYFSNQLARAALSNLAPITYETTTGIFGHANSGATAATYGNASFVPVVTVDASGHITTVAEMGITTNSISATLTNDAAGANNLGAFLSVVSATGGVTAPVTTAVYTNLCSMIVEAGDWDMEGSIELSVGATTVATRLTGGISLTTNAIDVSTAGGFMAYQSAGFVVSQKYIFPTGRRRISLSAATRVNLVGALTFTTLGGATWGANSFMSARRSR